MVLAGRGGTLPTRTWFWGVGCQFQPCRGHFSPCNSAPRVVSYFLYWAVGWCTPVWRVLVTQPWFPHCAKLKHAGPEAECGQPQAGRSHSAAHTVCRPPLNWSPLSQPL